MEIRGVDEPSLEDPDSEDLDMFIFFKFDWAPWEDDREIYKKCNPQDIPDLQEISRSCEIKGERGPTDKKFDLDHLYASFPPEIQLLIIKYLEDPLPCEGIEIAPSLPEYWRNRVYRRYYHVLFETEKYQLQDIDWQLLYYKMNTHMSSKTAPGGWKSRCQIFRRLQRIHKRYLGKPDIKPTPKELMLCALRAGSTRQRNTSGWRSEYEKTSFTSKTQQHAICCTCTFCLSIKSNCVFGFSAANETRRLMNTILLIHLLEWRGLIWYSCIRVSSIMA